jgi:putative molybdopterin biosynthesis protein
MLTTKQVSDMFSISEVTIRALIRRGVIPAYKIGGEYRLKPDEIEKYLDFSKTKGDNVVLVRGEDV